VVPGVPVEFLASLMDRSVLAGVFLRRDREEQGTIAVQVVVGVEEKACPQAGALEIGKTFRQKDGLVFRGAAHGLCVRGVVAHPRARVRRAEAEGTQGGLDGTDLQGAAVVSVQDDKSVH